MTPRRFLKSENGSYSVEAVIIFPILLWALGATFVFWDVYKLRNNAAAGTYTVADLVSRQTDAIDAEIGRASCRERV
jgi:Flp pilus assembly protein TadG